MSSKYHGTNTLVHNVSRNIIENEILDKIDRTSSTSKNQRNEFLFSNNREKDIANYKYLGKGNEHVRNERENEASSKTFSRFLKSEEPNSCKTYYAEGINNSKESTEADLKKKKITEIIEKYRNQLKMMHGQFTDSVESGRKKDKETEKNNGQKYEEKNKNNQTRLNEGHNENGIETIQRNIPYELHKERELVDTVPRNNKDETGVINSYFNERLAKHSNIKQLESERGCEMKYEMGTELYQKKSSTDFSKMGKEKEILTDNEKLHKGDMLHQFEDKGMVPHFMKDTNDYESSSLQQKKRMYIDLERAKQIDFKKEKILKLKNIKDTENLIEEKQETVENDSKKIKVTHDNEDDDMFPLRRFFHDSIAFDEFKIKDKFKEIEQIEQIIRSKNLLSPVKDVKEKEETYNGKMNVENKNELSGKGKKDTTYLFNETKEIGVTVEGDVIEGNSGTAHVKNVHSEIFSVEASKENKEEKGNGNGNGVLKDIYDSQRCSVAMNEKRWNNTLDYKYAKETGVSKKGQKDEEEKSTNEVLSLKFLNVENYVNKCKNRNQHSEYNDVISNINEINNTTNITNNSTNITNTVANTINSNSNVTHNNNNNNKCVEENGYYINRLNSKKCIFPIQDLIRKEEVQLVADYKENLCEKKNMGISKNIKKNNTDERRNHFPEMKLSNKNEMSYWKMEDPLYVEKNNLKYKEDIEKKRQKTRTSYYNGENLTRLCDAKEVSEQKDDNRNSEVNDYHKLNVQDCSLLKKKLEEKINEKDIPRIKEKLLEGTEKNSLKNKNLKCLINEEKDGIFKESVLSNEAGDITINTFLEGKKVYVRENKESSHLFLNTFTHDRKLDTTIKTAFTGEFRNSNFAVDKKVNNVEKSTCIDGKHLSNVVEKHKIDEANELQQKGMIHLSEKEIKQNGTDGGRKYETWQSKNRFRNNDDTKEIIEKSTNEQKDYKFGKNEQINKNIQMQRSPSVSLKKSMDIPMLTRTRYKTDYVMNKTYNETFNDNQQSIKNAVSKEPSISEKYEKNYKMLEKMRADLEEKTKQNPFFFSMNYSQNRNKSLRYKKVPDGLYVTYNESSSFPKKKRDSIIKDKVFDDDSDVKEEGKQNVQNLEHEYIKDKKQSIEQIQKELEIMKRYKNGENIEDIHERMIRDEINQKRKLYEETIRKNFEEKIKLRRKMLEQQKNENEKQGHKMGTTNKEHMSENEQREHVEEVEGLLNYESEKKKRRNKNRSIFDEYSSDGSYYRHLYKNLYDDECSKKWKNHFYDVSDNLYLQECSDIFFSNLKKRPSEDTSLTNSFDLELISLSKIKFDEFDYNYLNKIEKEHSLLTKHSNTVDLGKCEINSLEKEVSPTCSLKKPQVIFSDDSEKENFKCDDTINDVGNVNVNDNVLHKSNGEKENPILCKLVKRKNKENQKNNNWSEFIAEDAILNDSDLKNIKDEKETLKEVTMCKQYEPLCMNKQEEVMSIGNKEISNEGLNSLLCRNKNTGVNEIYTTEIPKTIDVERNMLAEKKVQHNSNSSKLKKNFTKKKTLPVKSNIENIPFKMPNLKKTNFEKSRPSLEKQKLNLEKQKLNLEKQKLNLEKQELNLEKNRPSVERKRPSLEKDRTSLEKDRTSLEKDRTSLEKNKPSLEKPKQIIENLQNKEMLLKKKVNRKIDTLHDNTDNGGKNAIGGNLEKHMSNEILNGNKKKNDMSYIMLKEKKLKANILEEEKKNMKIEELKKEETMIDTVKDSSSSSNKTMPKINILQNKENYIPLDLALNFVMDNQKLEKQVKKEKEKEIQRPNKKKTFTQWVMEERKKRLKNNLPIDI